MEKVVDEKKVIRQIRMDRDIDCIAIVISSWHYLNALAAMELLLKYGKMKKGIILACIHQQAGFIVDERLWKADCNQYIQKEIFQFEHLPQWKQTKAYLREKVSDKRAFYVLRPLEPVAGFTAELWKGGVKRDFIHIVIDEGLGFYLRSAKGWRNERRIIGNNAFVSHKKELEKWYQTLLTRIYLKNRKQLIYHTFFKKEGKKLTVNPLCKKYLCNAFERAGGIYNYGDYSIYENKLIICTQPFHDMGQIDNNADIEKIRQICERADKEKMKVIIKPHPREKDLGKYLEIGVEVDANNLIPLEIIIAGLKNKPKAIVGITTTTLVTANILWGINTVSVVNLINKINFHKEVKEDIDNFPKLFSEYVKIPQKTEALFRDVFG